MVGIVDYGTGNLRSVENALARLQTPYAIVSQADRLLRCDGVLLPGVGDARWAMDRLKQSGLDVVIPSLTCPVLGICLGMQLLCAYSEEGDTQGLGVFTHQVRYMKGPSGAASDASNNPSPRIKIPHVGWNTLSALKGPLFEGIPDGTYMYFVHSYAADQGLCTAAVTTHGTVFSAALQKELFFGCQFHPEKSGAAGARLLSNFIALCQK